MHRTTMGLPVLFLAGLLLISGCGESAPEGTVVRGKIFKGGSPVRVEHPLDPVMRVWIYPQFPEGHAEMVDIEEDGSFEFRLHGSGILPGRYKIGVEVRSEQDAPEQLKGRFSEAKTPIVRDLTGAVVDLGTIDLDDPK